MVPLPSDGGVVDGFGPLVLTGARGEVSRRGQPHLEHLGARPLGQTSTRPLADTDDPLPLRLRRQRDRPDGLASRAKV